MLNSDVNLKDYFREELLSLRGDAEAFGRSHPKLARALALHKGRSEDPHVELLLQAFAWLTGRLHYEMEEDMAALPNALMSHLQPHLEAPVPCMAMVEVDVKPDGANFARGATLERGRQFRTDATGDQGSVVPCRFTTTQDTPLWPIRVRELLLQPAKDSPLPGERAYVHSVLSMALDSVGGMSFEAMAPRRLRFYIDETQRAAWPLYERLALNLVGLAICCSDGQVRDLPLSCFQWSGFADSEAVLPEGPHSHPGYRLLQEYFAFPGKFLFFDILDADFAGCGESCQLLFLFDLAAGRSSRLSADLLRPNCVPLINLFPARIDPVALDHTRYEYRVTADSSRQQFFEVHTLLDLAASGPGRPTHGVAPWFALDECQASLEQDFFYATRRQASWREDVPGTELYISFLDTGARPIVPPAEVVGGRALCTNRRLPEQLRIGDSLQLEGPGPVNGVRVIAKPTAHHTPEFIGARPWALAGQLSLNHLSLVQGEGALAAFKSLLRRHVGPAAGPGLKQIDGIKDLNCRPVTRRIGRDAWRGFVPGLHVRLTLDRSCFENASAALFAAVLHHFLALYASVNTLVETSLETTDTKGIVKQWQPLSGVQPIL
ncbi:MAG: type VI secretion system baseplate subunit TssF [Rhodocyclaceae bacterium]|nr:type VI secretion system baseplate subunit TssF [Rhodocyclaceae bacterium]